MFIQNCIFYALAFFMVASCEPIVSVQMEQNKTADITVENSKVLSKPKYFVDISWKKLWPEWNTDKDMIMLGRVLEEFEKGRGKSSKKYKKLTKYVYPLLMGVLVAKIILIPLILKMLTAISTAALIMSKIALVTTGFLALKWIFSGYIPEAQDRIEFVYLPTSSSPAFYSSHQHHPKSYRDDQSWSDSTGSYLTTAEQKYIPINLKDDATQSYDSYSLAASLVRSGGKETPTKSGGYHPSSSQRHKDHPQYVQYSYNSPFL